MEECQLLLKYYSQPLEIATDGTLAEMIKKKPTQHTNTKTKKKPQNENPQPPKINHHLVWHHILAIFAILITAAPFSFITKHSPVQDCHLP